MTKITLLNKIAGYIPSYIVEDKAVYSIDNKAKSVKEYGVKLKYAGNGTGIEFTQKDFIRK